MFGLLIERCVGEKGVGGMMTDGISRTIDWLLDEDTEFPGEPAKVAGNPRKLHIRKKDSLKTLHSPYLNTCTRLNHSDCRHTSQK